MKRFAITSIICVALAGLFIFGMFGNHTAPLFIAFCGWTPAVAAWGFALARAGLRVSFVDEAAPPRRGPPPAAAQRRPRPLAGREPQI